MERKKSLFARRPQNSASLRQRHGKIYRKMPEIKDSDNKPSSIKSRTKPTASSILRNQYNV